MAVVFTTGAQVGRFVLETEIGHGSTGVVFRALDPVFQRPVALKILAQHLNLDESARARFEREAAAVARLKHPNIAQIYEFAALPDCLYLATEWIEGRTLAALLQDHRPLPLDRALRLFDQLGSALDYAHQNGVIHYDIKPANVIVVDDDHVYVVDFELAWLSDAPASTNAGMLFGTPRYMAPEQIRGEAVDGRADVYSLAAVLFEMLTGQPPFMGDSTPSLLYHHLYTPPPPITEVNPSLPVAVEAALLRALAKRPLNRFETAAELGVALRSPVPVPSLIEQGALGDTVPIVVGRRRSWLPAILPAWLWWVLGGSLAIWLLTFLAFRAHRLTVIPIPTVMATVARQSDLLVGARSQGKFPPLNFTPTPDGDDLTLRSNATFSRLALTLTALEPEPISTYPVTSGVAAQAITAATATRMATATPLPTQIAAAAGPTIAATDTEPLPSPTTAADSGPSQTPSLTPTQTLTPISPTPATSSPTATASSKTPTVATPTQRSSPTATGTPTPTISPTPSVAAPAADGWWPTAGGNAANSGFVSRGLPALNPAPRWQVPTTGGQEFGLVVGSGLVVYSTNGADVNALNWATGAGVWAKSLGSELSAQLALDAFGGNQAIVVAPTTNGLLALNLQTGGTVWRNTSDSLLGASLTGLTTGPDGTLYALTHSGEVWALKPSTGKPLWSRQLAPSDEYSLPPSLAGSTLLLVSRNKVARAFSLSSGTMLWSHQMSENPVAAPCVSESLGLVVLAGDQGTVYALRLGSGILAWSDKASSQIAGLASDGARVYATSVDGKVWAWDGSSGAPIWAVSAGSPLSSPPLTDGNSVLVNTVAGQVRYLSAATGQEMVNQRLTLNDALYQDAAPAGGWLFVRGTNLYGVSP
jgi:serine/threonine protein kinase/outer membrane protein assembly factor BamB